MRDLGIGWQQLVERVGELRDRFLPAQSPTGDYDADEVDHLGAYLLLVHAELEYFVEDVCSDRAVSLYVDLDAGRGSGPELTSFVRRCLVNRVAIANEPTQEELARLISLKELAHHAFSLYGKIVSQNHGIRDSNFRQLLTPLDLTIGNMGDDVREDLDALATARGFYAHHTVGAKVPPDPREESERVDRIVNWLRVWAVSVLR